MGKELENERKIAEKEKRKAEKELEKERKIAEHERNKAEQKLQKEVPCANPACKYQVTFHATHCCGACSKGKGHGPRCERKEVTIAPGAGFIDATPSAPPLEDRFDVYQKKD